MSTQTCPREGCTCETRGEPFCSDHCEKEARDGEARDVRRQASPCHCGHDGCGGSLRAPA